MVYWTHLEVRGSKGISLAYEGDIATGEVVCLKIGLEALSH